MQHTGAWAKEIKILNHPSITTQQILDSLLAILAFLPVTVCTGYMAGWFANLHGFRQRSLVERFFWSVPLSLAISTIAAVLIGKFLSLTAVVVFFLACTGLWVITFVREWLNMRRSGTAWTIGWRPLGGAALILAILWILVVILSLVDFQRNQQLFMSLTIFDHAPRVNWTESVLRSGVPPANSFYWYRYSTPMRHYYFWYVVCAAVARMAHLRVRGVFISSCVWSGFALVALTGLYLKHFLGAGARLRKQFLCAIALLTVSGLGFCVNFWNCFILHRPLPGYIEVWPAGQIPSWFDSILYDPHHVAGLVCCMLAFLLASMAGKGGERKRTTNVCLIALALASAFGLSIFVAFTFFLVMFAWALWQIVIQKTPRPALLLAGGGVGALFLLLPYLRELAGNSSGMDRGNVFVFAVREMIPPEAVLSTSLFLRLGTDHPIAARNLANLVLLAPGYAIELGLFLIVFLIFVVPAWRARISITPAQRSLVFIAAITIPIMSFLRSGVLESNDFGWRAALFVQFPMLLLASELIMGWRFADNKCNKPDDLTGLPCHTPHWLRVISGYALVIGVFSTCYTAFWLRFDLPLVQAHLHATQAPDTLSHYAYISFYGYAELDARIPRDAIVQFNPTRTNNYWYDVDFVGIDHQAAIASDQLWCGSELGGDPRGCPAMAAAIAPIFNGATAKQARNICHQFSIQYLVARAYDPAWKDRSGWVWTLKPVVEDGEFRALDCRE